MSKHRVSRIFTDEAVWHRVSRIRARIHVLNIEMTTALVDMLHDAFQ